MRRTRIETAIRTASAREPDLGRASAPSAEANRYTLPCLGGHAAANYNTIEEGLHMNICTATICSALIGFSVAVAPAHAQAPAYPAKTIRMVIALAPGGGVDTTGRF